MKKKILSITLLTLFLLNTPALGGADGSEKDLDEMMAEETRKDIEKKMKETLIEAGTELAELIETRAGLKPGVKKLQGTVEQLKKETKSISLNDYSKEAMDKFREDYIKGHKPTNEWNDEDRKSFQDAYNAESDRVKEEWKQREKDIPEKNRNLGKTIKELAEKTAELKDIDERIEHLERIYELLKAMVGTEPEKPDEKTAEPPTPTPPPSAPKDEKTTAPPKPTPPPSAPKEEKKPTPKPPAPDKPFATDKEVTFDNSVVAKIEPFVGGYSSKYNIYFNYKGTHHPYPCSFDESSRRGYSKEVEKENIAFYVEGDMLYLEIKNLHVECISKHYPKVTIFFAYSVTLNGAVFDDGSAKKDLPIHAHRAGTKPAKRGITVKKGFKIFPLQNTFTLRTITETGPSEAADCDDDLHIYISINGEKEHRKELDDPEDDFESKATNSFDREFDHPLETIKTIHLEAKGSDEWHCTGISFQFIIGEFESRVYPFKVDEWFSTEPADIRKYGAIRSMRFPVPIAIDRLFLRRKPK